MKAMRWTRRLKVELSLWIVSQRQKILRSILVVRKLLITLAPRMLLKFIPVACLMLEVVWQQMLLSTMEPL